MSLDGYFPIADHGLIGNHHTVALVGVDGTIDWSCCPRFESASLPAGILDKDKGGYFRISSGDKEARWKQFYFPDTNVLITRFFTPDGVGEVRDFMPWTRRASCPEDIGSSAGATSYADRCSSKSRSSPGSTMDASGTGPTSTRTVRSSKPPS